MTSKQQGLKTAVLKGVNSDLFKDYWDFHWEYICIQTYRHDIPILWFWYQQTVEGLISFYSTIQYYYNIIIFKARQEILWETKLA